MRSLIGLLSRSADCRILLTASPHRKRPLELSRLCAGLQLQLPVCPTPAASPLAHRHRTLYVCGCKCDEIVVYASACVLRNKMTCAMKLDYSEEEVRNVNLTL